MLTRHEDEKTMLTTQMTQFLFAATDQKCYVESEIDNLFLYYQHMNTGSNP